MPNTTPVTNLRIHPTLQNIEPALNNTLKTLVGDNYQTEIILYGFENLRTTIHKRIESLSKAYCFLYAAIPTRTEIDSKQIQEYHDFCLEQASSGLKTATNFLTLINVLSAFTAPLVSSICAWWSFHAPHQKSACQMLATAELYYLLTQIAAPLATLIPFAQIDEASCYLLLTVNKPLNPFLDRTIDELKSLQTNFSTEPDQLPAWFNHLQEREQSFLRHALQKMDLTDRSKVYRLSSQLRTILGIANYSQENCYIIDQHSGKIVHEFGSTLRSAHLASPDSYTLPEQLRSEYTTRNIQTLCTHVAQKPLFIQTLLSPGKLTSLFTYDEFLHQELQNGLQTNLIDHEKTMPEFIMSNHALDYARYHTYTTERNSFVTTLQQRITTLIAPPDHPDTATAEDLRALLENYQTTLHSGFGSASIFDEHGRELFLSSLELILCELGGYQNYSSCVTGKDCQAIALIHTQAMWLYRFLYNTWPQFTDTGEKRENFVRLVCAIYFSQHHQSYAAQNAPGSTGIANTTYYMPLNICDTIVEISDELFFLEQETQLASHYDIAQIVKNSEITPEHANYLLQFYIPARKIQTVNQNNLLDRLSEIINDPNFGQDKTTSSSGYLFTFSGVLQTFGMFKATIPTSLQTIIASLQNKKSTPTKKLADLAYYVEGMIQRSKAPLANLQNLYPIIKALFKSSNPDSQVEGTLENLDALLTVMREQNPHTMIQISQ